MSFRRRLGLLLLPCLLLPAGHAAAQTDARLMSAVRQAQEGQADSARAALRALLAATPPADSLYAQILYAMALAAADVAEREHDLQRVTIEYPLSSWTDDALLLLAESDYAGGNLPGTARYLDRIPRDFPASPLLPQVAFWAARTYFDMRNTTEACRWVAAGLNRPDIDAETRNQLAFQAQRCGPTVASLANSPVSGPPVSAPPAPAASAGDSTPAAPPVARPAPPPPARAPPAAADTATPVTRPPTKPAVTPPAPSAAGRYRVQLAAAGSQKEADGIVSGLAAAGITVDVTHEKGYYKVRTGHYRTRAEAQTEANRLRSRLGGGAFVVSE